MKSYGISKFSLIDTILHFKTNNNQDNNGYNNKSPKQHKRSQSVMQNSEENLQQSIKKIIVMKKSSFLGESCQKNIQSKLIDKKNQEKTNNRKQSVEAPSINAYLEQLQIIKQSQINAKKEKQVILNNMNQFLQQMKNNQKIRVLTTNQGSFLQNKFKALKQSEIENEGVGSSQSIQLSQISKTCKSQSSSARKVQELEQHTTNHIEQLNNIIKEFFKKLEQVRKRWQNDERLLRFLRFRTALKQEINQIFFPSEDENNLHLNQSQFIKLFKLSDDQILTQPAIIQLKEITQIMNQILEQQKFQELLDMKHSIQLTSQTISTLEQNKVTKKFGFYKDYDYLSYESLLMNNHNKDKDLELAERKVGGLNRITNYNRKMSLLINQTISNLKDTVNK